MSNHDTSSADSGRVTQAAADWLARRDRGLSAAEQDEYLRWLRQDPGHARALAAHEATLRRMMRLGEWQPAQSDNPNPDLFAPRRRRPRGLLYTCLAAAAAVALAAGTWGWRAANPPAPAPLAKSYLRVNERQALPDGSIVELKEGSHIVVDFSAGIRRVRLMGEAHFTVAKNPARPFIVEASGVEVRAVGTAFNVRQDAAEVEVVVTEGTVRIDPPAPAADANSAGGARAGSPLVSAGHRAVIPLAAAPVAPVVSAATDGEISETLAWQGPRFKFLETPLADAIAEFNRHNRQQLALARPELGAIPIGGTFRVNNVEGFVRQLETVLSVQVVSRTPDLIVLSRAR
jgi:transmembrane sensor